MSMIGCDRCRIHFDTDEDPDCWMRVGEDDSVPVCERCRETLEAVQEAEMQVARANYNAAPLSERNPAQYRQDMIDAGRGHLLGDEQ